MDMQSLYLTVPLAPLAGAVIAGYNTGDGSLMP